MHKLVSVQKNKHGVIRKSLAAKKKNIYQAPRLYIFFVMFNLAEHETCPAKKSQVTNNYKMFLAKHS